MMERRKHHGTPHIGRMNVDHLLEMQPATVSNRNPVTFENMENLTLGQLETLAIEIAGKHQLALFHGDEETLTKYETQMQAIAQHAAVIADPDN
jgi:hypothetical protein